MDVVGQRFTVSLLLVVVALLTVTSVSPTNAALGTTTSTSTMLSTGRPGPTVTYAHTVQNPTVTYAHTWRTTQDPTVAYSHKWNTGSRTWTSQTWSRIWSTTWSRRTHVYLTYTQTEYVPIQVSGCDPYDPSCYGYNGHYPNPAPGCDPTNPYCNSYPTPSYTPAQPPIAACDLNNPNCNGYPALQSMIMGAIQMTPATGVTAHDIWLVVVPLQGGQFTVILNGQGLQQNGSYLIEGVTRTQMTSEPLTMGMPDSEFIADANGNGVYWHMLSGDPRLTYGQLLLLYLPNIQMQGSRLIASAYLG